MFIVPAVTTLVMAAAAAKEILLPAGSQPEGVAHVAGTNYFAGDLRSGAVFLIDIATGLLTTAIPPQVNRSAGGLSASKGKLFVAGAGQFSPASPLRPTLYAYDIATGATLADCIVPDGGFVNDVFADRMFAYFTDSFRPYVYRLSVARPDACDILRIPLPRPDYRDEIGVIRANGVVKYRGGLIVTNSMAGTLHFIDLRNGNKPQRLMPPGSVPSPDGMDIQRRRGRTYLFITQNTPGSISVWRLSISNRVVSMKFLKRIRSKFYDFPTTIAVVGSTVFNANGRFDTVSPFAPLPPGARFSVSTRKF